MVKNRFVVVVPFHTDLLHVLVVIPKNVFDGRAAEFMGAPQIIGESPKAAANKIVYAKTGNTLELLRFHVTEEDEYLIHWYTGVVDMFACHSMLATDTGLGTIRLKQINGWHIPDLVSPLSSPDRGESDPGSVFAGNPEMQYIIPMARAALESR